MVKVSLLLLGELLPGQLLGKGADNSTRWRWCAMGASVVVGKLERSVDGGTIASMRAGGGWHMQQVAQQKGLRATTGHINKGIDMGCAQAVLGQRTRQVLLHGGVGQAQQGAVPLGSGGLLRG